MVLLSLMDWLVLDGLLVGCLDLDEIPSLLISTVPCSTPFSDVALLSDPLSDNELGSLTLLLMTALFSVEYRLSLSSFPFNFDDGFGFSRRG